MLSFLRLAKHLRNSDTMGAVLQRSCEILFPPNAARGMIEDLRKQPPPTKSDISRARLTAD
eukprot:3942310-Pyramimonas_sp.AAC.1